MLPYAAFRRDEAAVQRARPSGGKPGETHQRMHHAQLTVTVRELVAETFAELGVADLSDLRETILIKGGGYCGRRFETDAATAIWFVEEDQLKVFWGDGTLARVIQPLVSSYAVRAAA